MLVGAQKVKVLFKDTIHTDRENSYIFSIFSGMLRPGTLDLESTPFTVQLSVQATPSLFTRCILLYSVHADPVAVALSLVL